MTSLCSGAGARAGLVRDPQPDALGEAVSQRAIGERQFRYREAQRASASDALR
jgi:hypothetical protein